MGQRWNNLRIQTLAQGCKSMIYRAQGHLEAAGEAIQQTRQLANQVVDYLAYLDALQALNWLSQGQNELALRWAAGKTFPAEIDFSEEILYLALARVQIRSGQLEQALDFLPRLCAADEANGRVTGLIEALLVWAQAAYSAGQADQAFNALSRALVLGEPEGFLQVFLLVSVITSHFFHMPAYDASGETNMIVFALFLVAASTLYGTKKTENEEGR